MSFFKLFACGMVLCFLTGCSSTGRQVRNQLFTDNQVMKIYIVDEWNEPVKDYFLRIASYENDSSLVEGFTDRDGCLKIENMKTGNYRIEGKKTGYEFMKNDEVFVVNGEIYFCKVNSIESVLKDVENYYGIGCYEEGLEILDRIFTGGDCPEAAVISFYKACGYRKLNRKKDFLAEYGRFCDFKSISVRDFCSLGEGFIGGD